MTPVLVLAVGLLAGVGVYLVLARKLFSMILGLSLLTHAANLMMLSTGDPAQRAPFVVDGVEPRLLADPIPQALVLTAIVISMAVTLYLLATFSATARSLGSVEVSPAWESDVERDADAVRAELVGQDGSEG